MAVVRIGLFLLLLLSTGTTVLGEGGGMDEWIRLTNSLFSNYTNEIYPLYNFRDTLDIDISMFLLSIIDFDELSGIITLSAGVTLTWRDYRLQWTPNEYGGIKKIRVNSKRVWKPKEYVITAADDLRQFGSDEYDLDISYTGECVFIPGKLLKSTCTVDMSRFPVDTQICGIQMMLWRSPNNVQLSFRKSHVLMTWYSTNGEWNIDKTNVSYYMGYGSPSKTLEFAIQISRRYLYFIVSMTVPVMLLCFLNPFVFLLPSSSGERISYTITMFLSLAVYMTLIGDILPKVSENMAGMSYFLLAVLFYSGLLIILTIFTLRCESIVDVSEFPRWLRHLARCSCKLKKTKVVSRTKSAKVFTVRELGGNEDDTAIDYDPECLCIQHKDVMGVIDRSLFVSSLLAISVITAWFLLTYHS